MNAFNTNLSRLYVGWTTRVSRPDLLGTPKPPANYVKAETIERWQADQAEKQKALSLTMPGVARLDRVIVRGADGTSVASFSTGNGTIRQLPGVDFYYWLAASLVAWRPDYDLNCEPGRFHDGHPNRPWRKPWLVALDAEELGRIIAYEVMNNVVASDTDTLMRLPPWRLIRDSASEPMLLDPLARLATSEVRTNYRDGALVQFLYEADDFPTITPGASPADDASLCYHLCRKGGM